MFVFAEIDNVNDVCVTEGGSDSRLIHEKLSKSRLFKVSRQHAFNANPMLELAGPAGNRNKRFGHSARAESTNYLVSTYVSWQCGVSHWLLMVNRSHKLITCDFTAPSLAALLRAFNKAVRGVP